jgi:hypothetical protein
MYKGFQPADRRSNARIITTVPCCPFASILKTNICVLHRFSLFLWVNNSHFNQLVYIHVLKYLYVFQNKVTLQVGTADMIQTFLSVLFMSKRKEVTSEGRRLHNEELYDLSYSSNVNRLISGPGDIVGMATV